ncbi:huntingtin-associated protein 40 kDa isoform 2-T2 [Glossina fuscipes fuscipes]
MDSYPRNLVDQYLKTCNKLKKVEKALIKRFGPNVSEVLDDFARLAVKFEEAAIYQYAAMCQLGVGKCEAHINNATGECQALLRAARLFLRIHQDKEDLLFKCNFYEYREAALHCYSQAVEKCPDDSVMKAAIIREMIPLQPHYEGTSSFSSPVHRIYELELSAQNCLHQQDFLKALQQLDDIVDNIYERKKQSLYKDLLGRIEILRVLLLMAEFHSSEELSSGGNNGAWQPGQFLPMIQKHSLAQIVLAWHLENRQDLRMCLRDFRHEYVSLNESQKFLINFIIAKVKKWKLIIENKEERCKVVFHFKVQ